MLVRGTDVVLCDRCQVADRFGSRCVGLLRHRHLDEQEGLLIIPCASVHTWFMRFAIDVVWLDQDRRVLRIHASVPPFRVRMGGRGTHSVLELSAGRAARAGVKVGDVLEFIPLPENCRIPAQADSLT